MSNNPTINSVASNTPRRRRGRSSPPASRLFLEPLEDRRTPSFSPAVDYSTGTAPLALVGADFNGDTRLDLAVVNSDSTVSVLIGNGNGTFEPAVTSAAGNASLSLAVGDFNNDSMLDLAATHHYGGVSVLLGNGDGTFQAPTNIAMGSSPSSVAVGDFNDDGTLDLGVTSNVLYPGSWGYYGYYPAYHVGSAHVLLGSGDGTFSAPNTTLLGYGYRASAVIEDFNGDLKLDFAMANADSNLVSVLFGDGTGNLGAPTNLYAGLYPSSVAAGDVNGDGKLDLVTSNTSAGTVGVLLGNGLGGFGSAQSFAAGSVPSSIALAYFNDDSLVDLVTTNADSGTISVLLGTGSGSFRPPVTVAGAGVAGLVVGDFNEDGLSDVATANAASDNLSVLLNDGVWPALDAPTITIGDVTITEGNSGTVLAAFTVSLSSPYNQTVSVHYATADGTATLVGDDYQPASGTVSFAPGMTSQLVVIEVNSDRVGESDESFSVRLTDPINGFVIDSTGVGNIRDDETFISINSYASGIEGNDGTTLLTFTVSLTAPYDVPVTVDYSTAELTTDEEYWYGPGATAGVDYAGASGTVTIAAFEMTQTFTIVLNGDRLGEFAERFFVNLSNPTGARLTNSRSLGTIVDNEPLASIDNASVTEGNKGTKDITFTVTLSAASDVPVTINFATSDGSATVAEGDYQSTIGTVTFEAGETTKTIVVSVKGDRRAEYDEYFNLTLADATGALITNGTGSGTIVDNEPRMSITSTGLREGQSGTKVMKFKVTLSRAYAQPVTVRFATHNDTARVSNDDYIATSGKLTFAPGQKTKTISVTINGDTRREAHEYFYIVLSNVSKNVFLLDQWGWGAIMNDDGRRR